MQRIANLESQVKKLDSTTQTYVKEQQATSDSIGSLKKEMDIMKADFSASVRKFESQEIQLQINKKINSQLLKKQSSPDRKIEDDQVQGPDSKLSQN